MKRTDAETALDQMLSSYRSLVVALNASPANGRAELRQTTFGQYDRLREELIRKLTQQPEQEMVSRRPLIIVGVL